MGHRRRRGAARGRSLRNAFVLMHRWVGLVITVFLVSAGLTGSLIAFNDELEAWISPQLFHVVPPADAAGRIGAFELRAIVLQRYPGTAIDWVDLQPPEDPTQTVRFGLEPAPGSLTELANDEVFVDPYSGQVVGERRHGDITQGWKNFMPFVYRLHDSLALGTVGGYALGIASLLWTIDCFVGFYLTLPSRRARTAQARAAPAKGWWTRWSPAWKLRWRGGSGKLVFDLHRAGGLWVWAMLFVLAWSSVGFNLREVYRPAMQAIGYVEPATEEPRLAEPLQRPPIDWEPARQRAVAALSDKAAGDGFEILRERLIHYDAERGRYEYRALSTLDVGSKLGNTNVWIDATTGRTLRFALPSGRGAANTFDTWIMALHTAAVGGLPMQAFVSFMGAMVVLLSITGLVIWWRKRHSRRVSAARRAPA